MSAQLCARIRRRFVLLTAVAAIGAAVLATPAGARLASDSSVPYPIPIPYQIELRAWIPFDRVVDPFHPAPVPYFTNLGGNCFTPSSFADEARTSVDSYYRGDGHVAFGGSYRVSSIVSFDWDGVTISNLRATGSYGTTHRDLVYHTPSGDVTCNIGAKTATSATSGSGSGSRFEVGYSSKNPLTSQFLTPAIDSSLTGSVASDGTLTLSYADDLFPSHGIQVLRAGVPAVTDTVGDAACLGESHVVGPIGASILGWGLINQTNRGTLTVNPTDTGVVLSSPSPLCSASLWSTLISDAAAAGGGGNARDARAAQASTALIRAAPILSGVAGTPLSLGAAERAGLIAVTDTDGGTLITSDASRPTQITASGSGVVIRTQEIVAGRAGAAAVYGPLSGTIVLLAGERAIVTHDGEPVSPRRSVSHKPPLTRARLTLRGKRATIRLRAKDRAPIAYTRAFLGHHQLRIRHHRVTLARRGLARLKFYSVDVFGNVEPAHGLSVRQLRTARADNRPRALRRLRLVESPFVLPRR